MASRHMRLPGQAAARGPQTSPCVLTPVWCPASSPTVLAPPTSLLWSRARLDRWSESPEPGQGPRERLASELSTLLGSG